MRELPEEEGGASSTRRMVCGHVLAGHAGRGGAEIEQNEREQACAFYRRPVQVARPAQRQRGGDQLTRADLHSSTRLRLSTGASDSAKAGPVECLLTTAPPLEPSPGPQCGGLISSCGPAEKSEGGDSVSRVLCLARRRRLFRYSEDGACLPEASFFQPYPNRPTARAVALCEAFSRSPTGRNPAFRASTFTALGHRANSSFVRRFGSNPGPDRNDDIPKFWMELRYLNTVTRGQDKRGGATRPLSH